VDPGTLIAAPLAQSDRLCDGGGDSRTHGDDLRCVGGADEHQVLVPTDPGNEVFRTDAELEPVGDGGDELIPGCVAQGVVNVF
jgi:hypothetical protein